MKSEIITIGDELLRGEIVDSNKSFLSDRLLGVDVETDYHTSVRDIPEHMTDAFLRAAGRVDFVLVSGGLGPTRDDLTAEVLAKTFNREMRLDEEALRKIAKFFQRVGRTMTDNNKTQAYFPEGAEVLDNPVGTAPGFMLECDGTLFFCLPGVPREMIKMMDEQVLPRITARHSGGQVVRAKLIRTFGKGESLLDAELKDLAEDEDTTLGFRTSFPDNYLRPVVRAATAEVAEQKLNDLSAEIHQRLGAIIYGEGEDTLPKVVGNLLQQKGKTIAVAESCTGGLIAKAITDISGSSNYFVGGVVTYSNSAKSDLLGVDNSLIENHGAVSNEVVSAMADGARQRFNADIAVATSGISGPDGGSEEKPVGLVHIAIAHDKGTHAEDFIFQLDRARHRQITAQVALDWVRRYLIGVALVGPTLLRRMPKQSAAPKGSLG